MLGIFLEGERMTVILQGQPCTWGKCVFCPFALEQSKSLAMVISNNRRIIMQAMEKLNPTVKRVVVFNGGSFHELPFDSVEKLVPLAENRVLEIEERSEFVTLNSIKALLRLYNPSLLRIRVGLEVADERIRNSLLKKGISDAEITRLSNLREKLRSEGIPAEIWVYVLFGIEYIPENKVVESVNLFKRLFDGVIAIKYHRYLPSHPKEKTVSSNLIEFLKREADEVDMGGDIWIIGEAESAPENPS